MPTQPMGHAPGSALPAPSQEIPTGNISLPPPPTSDQVASLSKRISQGNPRRLSGGFYGPNSAYAGYGAEAFSSSSQQAHPATVGPSGPWSSVPDLPLIISTPKGVAGAYDPPSRKGSNNRGDEVQIIAPVPRHPGPGNGPSSRPTAERLEGLYSDNSSHKKRMGRGLLAPWRRSPSVSPGVVPVGVGRHGSRAGRSAAKNIKDARKRGWDPEKSRKKKKKKDRDYEAASSAGWTDVSTGSAWKDNMKDKKCVVM